MKKDQPAEREMYNLSDTSDLDLVLMLSQARKQTPDDVDFIKACQDEMRKREQALKENQ
jgi:hypothetical protein